MSETPPDQLTPAQAAALVRAVSETLTCEVRALPDNILSWHPAPGEWCIKEVLGHLIDADRRSFGGRLQAILVEDRPSLRASDQDAVERYSGDCARDAADLLSELLAIREEGARVIERVRPEQLGRTGLHPQIGEVRVSDLAHEWVFHDRDHLAQIFANVRGYVWPHMGATQGFGYVQRWQG